MCRASRTAPGAGPQPTFAEGERQPQQGGDQRGGYQQRQDRPRPQQQDRGPRPDRPYGDRQERGEFREGRRDFKPREFRPYRDPNPPRENAAGRQADSAAALPSFITAAPRVPGPMDAEVPARARTIAAEASGAVESGDNAFEASGDPRFPGRARRRRLRSPYGFHPSANQDEESEGPVPPERRAGLRAERRGALADADAFELRLHMFAVERLHQEVVGAGVHRAGDLRDIVFAGAEHHFRPLAAGHRPELA